MLWQLLALGLAGACVSRTYSRHESVRHRLGKVLGSCSPSFVCRVETFALEPNLRHGWSSLHHSVTVIAFDVWVFGHGVLNFKDLTASTFVLVDRH